MNDETLKPKNGEVCIKYIQALDGGFLLGRVIEDSNTKVLFSSGTNVYFDRKDTINTKYLENVIYHYVHASDIKSDFDIIKSFKLRDEMKDYEKWHTTLNYSMVLNGLLFIIICILIKLNGAIE